MRAIAPLHHPLNRYAVTGGALRRVPVDGAILSDSPPVRVLIVPYRAEIIPANQAILRVFSHPLLR